MIQHTLDIAYLENYEIHPHYQVLTQIKREPFEYSDSYIHAYDKLDCQQLSKLRYDYLVSIINRKPNSILDFGYGNGSFLSYCHEQGILSTYGYDISSVDPPTTAIRIKDLSKGFYDCITFFDSCEHVNDIGEIIKNLAPHNYVIISLPCCKEYLGDKPTFSLDDFMGWSHRKPNEHLWHFSPIALKQFMEYHGYKAINISFPEDKIRVSKINIPNILTGIFEKK